jgi:hypothetical protein
MATNLNNRKLQSGIYSDGVETFRIDKTDDDDTISFHAISDISYFKLRKGESIPLRKDTIESLINDDLITYRHRTY